MGIDAGSAEHLIGQARRATLLGTQEEELWQLPAFDAE